MGIKLIIIFTIIVLSLTIGMVASKKFMNRIEAINHIIISLKLLESTVMYTYDPIPVALNNVGKKTAGYAKIFFLEVSNRLSGEYVEDFHKVWTEAADEILANSALDQKELDIIKGFGAGFGTTDVSNQKSLFHHTYQMLALQLEEAISDKGQKAKVYQSIAAAIGLFIVIILI